MSTQEQKTILLVEDDVFEAIYDAQTIESFGYNVIVATSGEKAVEIADSNEKISLILMGIDLGSGIDWPEAMKQILRKQNIPIVFLTSHLEKEYVDRVKEITRYAYVLKDSGDFVLQSSIEMAFELFEANKKLLNTMETLRDSEEKWRSLTEYSPDYMALLDRDATTLFINHILPGLTKAQVIGSSFYNFTPKEYEQPTRECFERVLQTGQPGELESIHRYADGTFQSFESYVGPVKCDGEIVGLTVSSRDITERKRAEEKINALLEEKELLLREVHHHIKNNMNTMVSLLSLQSETLEDWKAVAALEDAKSRLQSMSVLYNKLYLNENLREMSIKDYLPALVNEIINVFPNKASVQIETRIDDFVLGVKLLSPLGIMVNELLTNAMKHAFIGRDDGLIKVSAAIKDHRATLVIEDNGGGIPETIDIENSSGFGLQLVGRLTKQIGGTIKIERENGTRFVLEFGL